MFICCGLSIPLPLILVEFLLDEVYLDDFRSTPWAYGGFIYILGAILYMFKIPEKFYPGKFDIIDQSHSIFHVMVLLDIIYSL